MTRDRRSTPRRTPPGGTPGTEQQEWLAPVAAAAAAASNAPVELLGEYLPMLAAAAIHGRRPDRAELDTVRDLGRSAAEHGVGPGQAVELYLSAAWRLWRELPAVERARDREKVRAAAEAVLRALDDSISALVEGHTAARRDLIRYEEALRRDFVDDLLRGDADVAGMIERAEPFGLDLAKPHRVALAAPLGENDVDRAAIVLERAVVDEVGDREVLLATKDGRVVVVLPAVVGPHSAANHPSELIHTRLAGAPPGTWWVATGGAYPGAYGIARSYEQAREAVALAQRLKLPPGAVDTRELLVYRVLGRDQEALVDLIEDVLAPLRKVRGGPAVLLETLYVYFACGNVATAAAARLGVSVRTVTYRLARVRQLTNYDPSNPDERFTLHTAVLGARLLDWPPAAPPS